MLVPVGAHMDRCPVFLQAPQVDIGAVAEKELGELAVIFESNGDVERRDASLVDKYPIGIGALGKASACFTRIK